MKLNAKNKTLLFVGVVFITFALLLVAAIYMNQKNRLEKEQERYYATVQDAYQKVLLRHKEFYYYRTLANVNSEGVIETFASRDRDKLYAITKGRWETLKKENPYLTLMHFHLPDGRSFLRMHQPQNHGDMIAASRPMVSAVHAKQSLLYGFESGIFNLAYRIFVPIFHQGSYIGALEFGSRPDQILNEMKFFNNLHGALYVKSHQLHLYREQSDHTLGDYTHQYDNLADKGILPHLHSIGYDFAQQHTFEYKGKHYSVYAFDLHDFSGQISAKALFFHDITPIYAEFQLMIVELIGLITLLLGVVLIVINVGFRRIVSALDDSNAQLTKNKEFLQSILEHSAHAIIATDTDGRIILFNRQAQKMLGYTEDEVIGKHTPELFHKPQELAMRAEALSAQFHRPLTPGFEVLVEKTKQGLENDDEWTYVTQSGHELTVRLHITALLDHEGSVRGYLGMAQDITRTKAIEREVKEYVKLIDENIITSTTDLEGTIVYASDAFCAISGYTKEELIGQNHRIVRHPDMPDDVYTQLWEQLTNDQKWEGEIKNKTKSGGLYWVYARIYPLFTPEGEKYGYTAIRQDITDKKRIEELSITDALTGIYNRRHFNDLFPRLVQSSKRSGETLCFGLMDVDHFKQYNDTYGHQMGDDVLIQVAGAIRDALHRSDDYCFRLGGEEFGVLFKTQTPADALAFAETIRKGIENLRIDHAKNSASLFVTVSMGLVILHPSESLTCDGIYKRSDDLLYIAKSSGRNRVCADEECALGETT
jgi:diguanylate cyclase (GGDEF)-like protein/PAS domain S-box-containing protein